MTFSTHPHKHSCGIELPARARYGGSLDHSGTLVVPKKLPTPPAAFLRVLAPYREDRVVGGAWMFTWSWLAALCSTESLAFVLGPAL